MDTFKEGEDNGSYINQYSIPLLKPCKLQKVKFTMKFINQEGQIMGDEYRFPYPNLSLNNSKLQNEEFEKDFGEIN